MQEQFELLAQRLAEQHGELMTAAEVAHLLRYRNAVTLRRAITAGRVPLRLLKVGPRTFVSAVEVARYLTGLAQGDAAEAPAPACSTTKEESTR